MMSYSTMEALSGGRVVSWGRRSVYAPERKTLEEKTENETMKKEAIRNA